MKLRNILAKLLLLALIGVLVPASAYAAGFRVTSETSLRPSSDWALSKIDAKDNAGEFCALARRFNNNFILTLARNGRDESSVALDFQRRSLDKNKTYDVVIDPGFKQRREYTIRPVSENALVLRLGEDYAFHDALSRSRSVKISIEGEDSFAFNMPDLDKGQEHLNTCLLSITEPAAGEETQTQAEVPQAEVQTQQPVQEPPRTVQANTVVPEQAKASVNEEAVNKLRIENNQLRQRLEQEREAFKNQLLQESQQESGVVQKLSGTLENLEQQNKVLRAKLEAAEQGNVKEAVAVPQPLIEPQTCEVDTDVPIFRENNTVNEALVQEAATLKTENERLRQQLQNSGTGGDVNEALAREAAMLREENERLKSQRTENKVDNGVNQELAREAATLRKENEILKQRVEDSLGNGDLAQEIASLRKENDALKKQQAEAAEQSALAQDLAREAANLKDENEILRARIEAVTQDMASLDRKADQVDQNLQSRVSKLEQQLVESSREAVELREQLAAREKELELARTRLSDAEMRLSSASGSTEELATKAELALRELDEANRKLAEASEAVKAANLKAQQSDERIANAEARAQAAEKRAAEAEKSVEKSYEQATFESRSKVDKLLDRIAILEAENDTLENMLAGDDVLTSSASDNGIGDDSRILVRIKTLESELSSVKEQRDNYERDLNKLRADVENDLIDLAGSWDLETATRRYNEAEREISRLGKLLENQRVTCRKEVKEVERMLFDPEVSTKQQRDHLTKLEKELIRSRTALSSEKVKYERELKRAHEEKDALEQKLVEAREKIETLQSGQKVASVQSASQLANISPAAGTVAAREVRPQPVGMEPVKSVEPHSIVPSEDYESQYDSLQHETPAYDGKVKPSSSYDLISADAVQVLLQRGQVSVSGGVRPVESLSEPGIVAYEWNTGPLYGSLEQRTTPAGSDFQGLVNQYLTKTKSRCGGEFAAIPEKMDKSPTGRIAAAYEIACINGNAGDSASASLIFVQEGLTFTTIAHETGVDYMDQGITARDSLYMSIVGVASKLARR